MGKGLIFVDAVLFPLLINGFYYVALGVQTLNEQQLNIIWATDNSRTMEVKTMDEVMNTTNVSEETVENTEEEVKTYTQEEVLKLLQSETDKRVSQALKTQQKKYEKQLSLSKLDGDERAKAEKDNRIAELEEQLAQFQIERNKSELKSVLSSRGLSAEFADIITINDDIEASQANIDRLDKLFKAAVKAEVEKRLASNAPKGNNVANTEITKEVARKMSMAELSTLPPEQLEKLFS